MLKKPENKTRKRLRITQCVLFLAQILFCTFTFVQIPNPDPTKLGFYATVFDMFGYLGGQFPDAAQSEAFSSVLPLFFVFLDRIIVTERTVDVNITRLRKKLGAYAACIVTRLGFGYTFEEQER